MEQIDYSQETLAPQTKSNFYLLVGILVAIIFILLGAIWFLFNYQNNKQKKTTLISQSKTVISATPTVIKIMTPSINVVRPTQHLEVRKENIGSTSANWKKYTNSRYQYSLFYPEDFIIEELPQSPTLAPSALPVVGNQVKNKGDVTCIYSLAEKGQAKGIALSVNDSTVLDADAFSQCYYEKKEPQIIELNKVMVYEIPAGNKIFGEIVSKFETKKDNGGREMICVVKGISVNGHRLEISSLQGGISEKDSQIVREILKTITY